MASFLGALAKFWPIVLSVVGVIAFAIRLDARAEVLMERVDNAIERAADDRETIRKQSEEDRRARSELQASMLQHHKEADTKIALLSDIAKNTQTLLGVVIPEHAQKIKGLEDRVHTLETRPSTPVQPPPVR